MSRRHQVFIIFVTIQCVNAQNHGEIANLNFFQHYMFILQATLQFSKIFSILFHFIFLSAVNGTTLIILETKPPQTTTAIPPTQTTTRRQDSDADNEIEDERRSETKTRTQTFSAAMCASLRVPCRFVTEHPCCQLPQDIGMLGR